MHFCGNLLSYNSEQVLKGTIKKGDGLKSVCIKKYSEILCKVSTDVQSQWHLYLSNTLKNIVGKLAPFKTSLYSTLVKFYPLPSK